MTHSKTMLFVFVLFISHLLNAQTGILKGKVFEDDGKTRIPFAKIIVESKGIKRAETTADSNGCYLLKKIPNGKYEVKAIAEDYTTAIIKNVLIQNAKTTFLDIKMQLNLEILSVVESYEYDESPSIEVEYDKMDVVSYDTETDISTYKSPKKHIAKESGKDRDIYTVDSVNPDIDLTKKLTAGEVNDYTKWIMWNDISANELSEYAKAWNVLPKQRYCVQLSNKFDNPVVNASVQLLDDKKNVIFETKTDNTGKAELWSKLFSMNDSIVQDYSINIEYQNKAYSIKKARPFKKGINFLKLPVECDYPGIVDVMFVVDATGSMGDEISYLQAELLDIIKNAKTIDNQLLIRLGSVFYRDKGDEYITRKSDFSSDINQTITFISSQKAAGGGDYEESVDEALNEAINNCKWSSDARARILFLVLDAPPHNDEVIIKKIENLIITAAKKGIRVIPIMGSGVDKSTEYLFRSMALATNGTYTFLTDDSGIGGLHIKPTTDIYKVELLNDLIFRLFKQFVIIPQCNKPIEFIPEELKPDTTFLSNNIDTTSVVDSTQKSQIPIVKIEKPSWKIYPNPTSGEITVEISGNIIELFITDNSGKILEKVDVNNSESIYRIDLSKYPNGIYFVRYYYAKDCSVVGKVILNR